MLERGACAEVAQLGLHHRAQVAGRVVARFDDLAGLALEDDDHSAPDLCRWIAITEPKRGLSWDSH